MPEFLPKEHIKAKPIIAQRKNVHSFIYPTKVDLMRHEMKQKLKGSLSYEHKMNPASQTLDHQDSSRNDSTSRSTLRYQD